MNVKKSVILFFIVILIIILLFLTSFMYFGKINDYLPTGNVDVFDISIDCNCDTPQECTHKITISKNDSSENKDFTSNSVNSNNTQTESSHISGAEENNVAGNIFIDDDNGNYIYQNELNIFSNPAYEMKKIIAPSSTNLYHFVVHNSSENNIKYEMEMIEYTEYPINMKYRLKQNNQYVIGDEKNWVTASELYLQECYLNEKDSSVYALEWKWFDSDNEDDNVVGKNMRSLYKLDMKLNFNSVE